MSVYWILDLDARLVERWTPNDARPEILVDVLEWRPIGAAETFRLDLPRYFAEILDDFSHPNDVAFSIGDHAGTQRIDARLFRHCAGGHAPESRESRPVRPICWCKLRRVAEV